MSFHESQFALIWYEFDNKVYSFIHIIIGKNKQFKMVNLFADYKDKTAALTVQSVFRISYW